MKPLLFITLIALSLPVGVYEPRYTVEADLGIGDKTKGLVEPSREVQKVAVITDDPDTWTEHECLARNIYWESKGEGVKGMALTAQITLNRVNSNKRYFPNTVCQVVRQKLTRGCSFSWFCDGKSDKPRELARFEEAKEVATKALQGEYKDLVKVKYYKRCDTPSDFFNTLVYKFRYKNHCYFGEV
jgi:spore germination cell wall hydrolase CwlJ-like protein